VCVLNRTRLNFIDTHSIIVEAIFHGTVIVLKLIIKIDKSWRFYEWLLDLDIRELQYWRNIYII